MNLEQNNSPVPWKEICFYCKKYQRVHRLDNKINLRGTCLITENIVYKDYVCTYYDYNGY
jgi:hypothetical protein